MQKRQSIHKCACQACQRHPYSKLGKEHRTINRVLATLDERNRRRFVGLLALQWGRGGVQRLNEITGLSRMTIRRGREEITHPQRVPHRGIRAPGGGRQRIEKNNRAS